MHVTGLLDFLPAAMLQPPFSLPFSVRVSNTLKTDWMQAKLKIVMVIVLITAATWFSARATLDLLQKVAERARIFAISSTFRAMSGWTSVPTCGVVLAP